MVHLSAQLLKCLVPTSCSLNKDRLPVQRLYERLVRGELRRGELRRQSAVLVERLQLGGGQVQGDGDLQRGVEKAKLRQVAQLSGEKGRRRGDRLEEDAGTGLRKSITSITFTHQLHIDVLVQRLRLVPGLQPARSEERGQLHAHRILHQDRLRHPVVAGDGDSRSMASSITSPLMSLSEEMRNSAGGFVFPPSKSTNSVFSPARMYSRKSTSTRRRSPPPPAPSSFTSLEPVVNSNRIRGHQLRLLPQLLHAIDNLPGRALISHRVVRLDVQQDEDATGRVRLVAVGQVAGQPIRRQRVLDAQLALLQLHALHGELLRGGLVLLQLLVVASQPQPQRLNVRHCAVLHPVGGLLRAEHQLADIELREDKLPQRAHLRQRLLAGTDHHHLGQRVLQREVSAVSKQPPKLHDRLHQGDLPLDGLVNQLLGHRRQQAVHRQLHTVHQHLAQVLKHRLGDEGREGRHHLHQAEEDAEEGVQGEAGVRPAGVAALQAAAVHAHVPVGEVVDELDQARDYGVEAKAVGVEPRQEDLLQQLLDALLAELEIFRPDHRRVDQVEAEGVGAELPHHAHRIGVVLLALAHLLAVGGEDEAIADQISKGRLPKEHRREDEQRVEPAPGLIHAPRR
ncbi:hypothetical protein TYRP_018028 [Tyrophagus putrescentiae]|nr:hypothetical protein TYRP_018028 [Tyrophagus putrescentiae]